MRLIQVHDCGVDTDVVVSCTRCGSEQEIMLPFGQRGFFSPKSVKRSELPSMDEAPAEEADEGGSDESP